MRHNFDIFEKFPDGSTLWRACVSGRYETQRKMQELTEHSKNEFYAIDILIDQNMASPVKSPLRSAAKAAASG
jgi:hypothetical protein